MEEEGLAMAREHREKYSEYYRLMGRADYSAGSSSISSGSSMPASDSLVR